MQGFCGFWQFARLELQEFLHILAIWNFADCSIMNRYNEQTGDRDGRPYEKC
ncbi:MAG: hypothetical protein FWG64_14040 [Firmicutes bacterium]|nr:hypothetical protein [Bacillota bacterium]